MGRIGIGVAQEVCQGDSRKGIVVGKGGFVELDHNAYERYIYNQYLASVEFELINCLRYGERVDDLTDVDETIGTGEAQDRLRYDEIGLAYHVNGIITTEQQVKTYFIHGKIETWFYFFALL